MGVLNSILGAAFDVFFAPFLALGPWPGMIAISLITGILMLLIFKKTSNQAAIKKAKNQIKARLLEIRLFKNDTRGQFRSQGAMLAANFRYMVHALRPMLVMIIPVMLILAQLNLRYGASSLLKGEQAIVKLKLAEGTSAEATPVALQAPAGITVETPPLRIEEDGEVDWRIRADAAGLHRLSFDVGGTVVDKAVTVDQDAPAKVATLRSGKFFDLFLTPGEKPMPKKAPIETIKVVHRPYSLPLFGGGINWLVAFFILSLVFGFALKGVFKVEI